MIWGIAAGLVATRVVLLAHWASDVAAGLVVGAVTERILRLATGYSRERGLPTGVWNAPRTSLLSLQEGPFVVYPITRSVR